MLVHFQKVEIIDAIMVVVMMNLHTMDTVMVVGTTAEDIDITAKKAAMVDILNVHQEINMFI